MMISGMSIYICEISQLAQDMDILLPTVARRSTKAATQNAVIFSVVSSGVFGRRRAAAADMAVEFLTIDRGMGKVSRARELLCMGLQGRMDE